MKKLLTVVAVLATFAVNAQTNTFPTTGSVGIGTTTPTAKLQVLDNARNYYVNRAIPGSTTDNVTIDYLLLHEIYTSTLVPDQFVMGKITGVRGNTGAYNRKWTVEVNTASAYNTNKGTLISYNEPAKLVTVVYNGKNYLAVEIAKLASLYYFSFTGYANNETLLLVTGSAVSNPQPFIPTDVVSISGIAATSGPSWTTNGWTKALKLNNGGAIEFTSLARSFGLGATGNQLYLFHANADGTGATNYFMMADGSNGNMTIGGSTIPANYKLTVEGTLGARRVKVQQGTWSDYVFHPDYQLPSLQEVESFVKINRHLPDIPSEKEVKADGLDLGEFDNRLLKKVEELTLYIIELNKTVEALNKKVATQEEIISKLSSAIPAAK